MLKLRDNKHPIKILKDPFKAANITSISIRYSKVMFESYFAWRGEVSFKNGNTTGDQSFEVTDDESDNAFEQITKDIQSFINNL